MKVECFNDDCNNTLIKSNTNLRKRYCCDRCRIYQHNKDKKKILLLKKDDLKKDYEILKEYFVSDKEILYFTRWISNKKTSEIAKEDFGSLLDVPQKIFTKSIKEYQCNH